MRRVPLLVVVAGLLIGGPATAAQEGEQAPGADIPSVSVLPTNTDPSDPNAGQWFVTTISPGQTGRLTARIYNPASVDQIVRLTLADLDFAEDGTPTVADVSQDVGTWGAFDQPTVTVPALQQVEVGFSITAPEGAEPGDHVGVVMAETTLPADGRIGVVKRIATRLYVTVPGDAQPAFVIDDVAMQRDSSFFTRSITFTVTLRNTGRVRLQPTVTVDGREAKGSEQLMSRSIEPYVVKVPVPAWGGPLTFDVEATARTETRQGPVRTRTVSAWVIPWVLIAGVLLTAGLVVAVRRWMRRRVGRYDALRADLRRLERLVADQVSTPSAGGRRDARSAIRAGIKQAARAGDTETEERLKEKLTELESIEDAEGEGEEAGRRPSVKAAAATSAPPGGNGAALATILEEIARAPKSRQEALIQAARSYGPKALREQNHLVRTLAPEVRRRLQSPVRRRARGPAAHTKKR